GINIALCFLLGLQLGWGVAGVAWATVTGEFLAMLLGLAIVLLRLRKLERPSRRRILDLLAYRRMLSLNRDIMIRSFSLLAAFTALSGVLAFQMDGVFIGATWSREMRNMMLVSFLAFSAALITLAPAFGNNGLWASLHVFLLVRGLSLLAVLRLRVRTAFN